MSEKFVPQGNDPEDVLVRQGYLIFDGEKIYLSPNGIEEGAKLSKLWEEKRNDPNHKFDREQILLIAAYRAYVKTTN